MCARARAWCSNPLSLPPLPQSIAAATSSPTAGLASWALPPLPTTDPAVAGAAGAAGAVDDAGLEAELDELFAEVGVER